LDLLLIKRQSNDWVGERIWKWFLF
jgi:hypothetical protein